MAIGNNPVQTKYTSKEVAIPDSFLTSPPPASITVTPVPFAAAGLTEYKDCFAVILENVLSPAECKELIVLAESSTDNAAPDGSPWQPALINIGMNFEVAAPGYRQSDRIIWDQQTVVDRLWARCAFAEGLRERLAEVREERRRFASGDGKWVFSRFNERMRFLKYSPGEYFKPHCDGHYGYFSKDGREFDTQYTVHLYLNDSAAATNGSDPAATLEGGATAFLSSGSLSDGEKKRLNVNPKAGSVLIFQHDHLLHEGAEVTKGVKYTMRTDILYEWVAYPPNNNA